MAERKSAKHVGSDSPGSESAKEQRIAGMSGGPQASRDDAGTERQPPQTSNRRSAKHEHEPTVRKGYEAAQDPERQGDGDPGPDSVRESSKMQGHGGRSHSGASRANDVAEQSQQGSPRGEHTRHGRQDVPGDRNPRQG